MRTLFFAISTTAALAAACTDSTGPIPATCADPPAAARGSVAAFTGSVTIAQLHEGGVPLRESELRLELPGRVEVCDPSGVALVTVARDPAAGDVRMLPLNVLDARADNGTLVLRVDGPVAAGGRLILAPGSLLAGGGAPAAETFILSGPELLDPVEAALWFRPVRPTNVEIFSTLAYAGSPNVTPPAPTESESRTALENYLDAAVAAGRLDRQRADALMASFESPAVRANYAENDGTVHTQLLAATLATAGTVGERTIDVLVEGENPTGQPALIRAEDLPPIQIALARVVDGRLVITYNVRALNQPLPALAALTAHEAMHQDNLNGQKEEIVARVTEIAVYAGHVLLDPAAADTRTALGRFYNLVLLSFLNSGRSGYPRPGHRQAPLTGDPPRIFPGTTLTERSLNEWMRLGDYATTPDVDTPGHPYLDAVAARISDQPRSGLAFDDATEILFDDVRAFAAGEHFRLLEILELSVAE